MKDSIDTKKYPFPEDERLKKVKFIVTDGDTFAFWVKYHNYVKLVQDMSGLMFQYADFGDDKQCWASLWFYEVDGVFTAFVDAHGAYFDHFKLENYVFTMCGMKMSPNNHCDGNNIHNHPAIRAMTLERYIEGMNKDMIELKKQIDHASVGLKTC